MLSRISSTSHLHRTLSTRCLALRYASNETSQNKAIIEMLRTEIQQEEAAPAPNKYKLRNFKKALAAVSNSAHPIQTVKDLKPMDGIGKGITLRIAELLSTSSGKNTRDDVSTRKEFQNILLAQELERVPLIGKQKAQKLVEAGCRSIADLKDPKYLDMLAPAARLNAKYFEHLSKPVTREEAETVAAFIGDNISSKHEIIIVGDHRRGRPTCNAIYILLLHPDHVHIPVPSVSPPHLQKDGYQPKPYISLKMRKEGPLLAIIRLLKVRGLIASDGFNISLNWHGVIRMPDKDGTGSWLPRWERTTGIAAGTGDYRRLYLNFAPIKSRGAALIAHTGDNSMKRHLKLKAKSQGLYLDELGLWKWHPDSIEGDNVGEATPDEAGKPAGFWQLLTGTTEEAIFEQLGMEYIPPERRNMAFVS
ncbi:putative DNA polymerase family X [Hypsizygus marmoreus]|uniref:DNA polymerase n=1 Tax=Hypsizygus marmoreus TaxID=39966 RepID=A0A369J4W9_HYPMA|nr:putative DNA polymerase family X [Hypsizygus marmoreus]